MLANLSAVTASSARCAVSIPPSTKCSLSIESSAILVPSTASAPNAVVSTAPAAKCEEPIPSAFTLTAPVPSVADNSIVESSTVTSSSSALAVIPSPPITLTVKSPEVPPPVRPVPAVTPVTSPALATKFNFPDVSS